MSQFNLPIGPGYPRNRFCAICGWLIEEERREALPQTRLCSVHARAITRFGGEFFPLTVTLGGPRRLHPPKFSSTARRPNPEALEKLRQVYTLERTCRQGIVQRFQASWRTDNVVNLAETLVQAKVHDTLPILADALEDAGCTDADLLDYCRRPERWWDAEWVTALILERKEELKRYLA